MIKVGPQKGLLLLPSRDNVICQGAMRGGAIQALPTYKRGDPPRNIKLYASKGMYLLSSKGLKFKFA